MDQWSERECKRRQQEPPWGARVGKNDETGVAASLFLAVRQVKSILAYVSPSIQLVPVLGPRRWQMGWTASVLVVLHRQLQPDQWEISILALSDT